MIIDKDEISRKDKIAKDEGFKSFMAQPTIRILMSKLPETEPEILEALLKEAHDRGWNGGAGHNAVLFAEIMLRSEKRR